MNFFKKLSLVPTGLKYKLVIAFCLMSVIPLLVIGYIVRDYIFPPSGEIISLSWLLFCCIFVAFLGFLLAKQMIEHVIEMSIEAKLMAQGDFSRSISVEAEDEIGDIGNSLNQLTARIKENMAELKSFGEKTKLIDIEIHKRVLVLSSLLQIGENISASKQMDDIMGLIVDKITQVMDEAYAMLFLAKAADSTILECNIFSNVTNDKLRKLEVKSGDGLFGGVFASDTAIHADSNTKFEKGIEAIRQAYGIRNFAAFPIISRKKSIGMLLIGNEIEGFIFKTDDLELIKVFAKQAAIAFESNELTKKTKKLAIKDDLTDLYNEKYIDVRLEEEIKRALLYQRPCSYVIFSLDDFDNFRQKFGDLATEKALLKVSTVFKDNVTQIGRAARLSGSEFALLLPEKNKKEAYRIAEKVRKQVENLGLGTGEEAGLTVSGGVSENPLDGSTAAEIVKKASDSVSIARAQGKNRIV